MVVITVTCQDIANSLYLSSSLEKYKTVYLFSKYHGYTVFPAKHVIDISISRTFPVVSINIWTGKERHGNARSCVR